MPWKIFFIVCVCAVQARACPVAIVNGFDSCLVCGGGSSSQHPGTLCNLVTNTNRSMLSCIVVGALAGKCNQQLYIGDLGLSTLNEHTLAGDVLKCKKWDLHAKCRPGKWVQLMIHGPPTTARHPSPYHYTALLAIATTTTTILQLAQLSLQPSPTPSFFHFFFAFRFVYVQLKCVSVFVSGAAAAAIVHIPSFDTSAVHHFNRCIHLCTYSSGIRVNEFSMFGGGKRVCVQLKKKLFFDDSCIWINFIWVSVFLL